jgi:hypothetical protein
MLVICPHCGFLVAAQSGTGLRCPRCGAPVDPRTAKRYEKPDKDKSAAAQPDAGEAEAAPAEPVRADDQATADEAAATQPPSAAESAPPLRTARGRHAPSFLQRRAPAPTLARDRRLWIAIAALAVVLVLQVLLAQREALAADARWRPLVSGVCGALQCEVPAWREPAAFTMLQRSVQPRRDAAGVLSVTASFRNDARWPQAWPTLLLTLSDMDGRQVGMRAFKPSEYRPGAALPPIAPGQSATIQMDVVEPARRVVAFTFDFQ